MTRLPSNTLHHWMAAAFHACPLGPRAVEDQVRLATVGGVAVYSVSCRPTDVHGTTTRVRHDLVGVLTCPVTGYAVCVLHGPDCSVDPAPAPDRVHARVADFQVSTHSFPDDWEAALAVMADRQAAMPPHLRGLPVNVTRAEYVRVLHLVQDETGYDRPAFGDLWVHEGPNALSFGCLTRRGEIAIHKYTEDLVCAGPGGQHHFGD
jgi:hypothetical protein